MAERGSCGSMGASIAAHARYSHDPRASMRVSIAGWHGTDEYQRRYTTVGSLGATGPLVVSISRSTVYPTTLDYPREEGTELVRGTGNTHCPRLIYEPTVLARYKDVAARNKLNMYTA